MKRSSRILAASAVLLSLAGAAGAADEHAGHSATTAAAAPMIHADLIGLDGKTIGMVMLQETPAGVLVSAEAKGIPAGEHGFHFHQKGVCDTATKFDSSGGHFTGGDHQHGYMVATGPHGGDMPNQNVGTDGLLKTQVLNSGVTLSPGPKSLLDADGSALVIHAGVDDYTSQPSGNAGGRIACAVIAAAK